MPRRHRQGDTGAGARIVAALDRKADRLRRRLQARQWTWMIKRPPRAPRTGIEAALHSFRAIPAGRLIEIR